MMRIEYEYGECCEHCQEPQYGWYCPNCKDYKTEFGEINAGDSIKCDSCKKRFEITAIEPPEHWIIREGEVSYFNFFNYF